MINNLQIVIVLYREPEMSIFDIPLGLDAYPNATIEWVYYGDNVDSAYEDFYDI